MKLVENQTEELKKAYYLNLLFKELDFKDHLEFINFIYDPQRDRRSNIASIAKIIYKIALKGEKRQ